MEWLSYLLKVSACMALFYAFYHFFLQRLTFFSTNRMYLLSTLLLSFIIPAMELQLQRPLVEEIQPIEEAFLPAANNIVILNPGAGVNPSPQAEVKESIFADWQQLLVASYWLGAMLMFGVFAFQAFQLLKHTINVSSKIGRLKVVVKATGFTNCSFLNYVFIDSENLNEKEIAVILQHEKVHVDRYHSVDKILISTCKVVLWFNPVLYLYSKALEQVHEYEADKETSKAIGNTPYANVLLAIAVRQNNPSLVHSFVKNPLKGRIKMLFTNQSRNMKKLAYLIVLPLGLALTWAFAVQVVYATERLETPVQKNIKAEPIKKELPFEPPMPQKSLSIKNLRLSSLQIDTLRMVNDPRLGKNPVVIIDGKDYDSDMLTKISPRCIKTKKIYIGKVEITTIDNKIEYATKIDRANVVARNKANALNKFYVRYEVKNQDGSSYDEIQVKLKKASTTVGLPTGSKLLLLIDYKQYTEAEAASLSKEQFSDLDMLIATGLNPEGTKMATKYGIDYRAMIEIKKFYSKLGHDSKTIQISPTPFVEHIASNYEYSARDSVTIDNKSGDLMLYGDVNVNNDMLSIKADKVRIRRLDQIAIARNVRFKKKGKGETIIADFVKFNLNNGTHEVFEDLKGL